MTGGNLDHCPDGHDIPLLLDNRLSDLKIIDGMGELCDYTKDVFLNKVAYQV
jgi:hypothetical protein